MSDSLLPTEEEYRRYDRIWQRVSPELVPYPEVREPGPPPLGDRHNAEQELRCMGPVSERELETLREAIKDELTDAQIYRYLARQAPFPQARRTLQAIADEESGHARTLQAMLFLITGETARFVVQLPPQPRLPWRDRLREQCREELQGGNRYAQAARQTRDVCLRRVYRRLSRDEFHHAERLRELLEQTLQRG